jgi:hypothetical protein
MTQKRMSDRIEEILAERRKAAEIEEAAESQVKEAVKFFETARIEGEAFHYLELRFREGQKSAFKYEDLSWFDWKPSGILIMNFMGWGVSIKGRGFWPDVFHAIKTRRLSWIKEADSEFQDSPEYPCFVEEIIVEPPDGFAEDEEGGES